jgi:hypothetical protein
VGQAFQPAIFEELPWNGRLESLPHIPWFFKYPFGGSIVGWLREGCLHGCVLLFMRMGEIIGLTSSREDGFSVIEGEGA